MNFENKLILAPMVRCGSLPARLQSLRYGADIVYSPEFVSWKIVHCSRYLEDKGKLICYRDPNGSVVFKTIPQEKPYLVFQLGASTPESAVEAAKVVERDVSAIDLNCGCPKKFSVHAGMGAALLEDVPRLCSILKALKANVTVPVTCKIRIFDSVEQTLDLVRAIASTGIDALAVHCRTKKERPADTPHHSIFKHIVSCLAEFSIPLIANGDVFTVDAIKELKGLGVSSFMAARAPLVNMSIFSYLKANCVLDMSKSISAGNFSSRDLLVFNRNFDLEDCERYFSPSTDCPFPTEYNSCLIPLVDVIRDYARIALVCVMPLGNIKFTLCSMRDGKTLKELFQKIIGCKTHKQLADILDLSNFYNSLIRQTFYSEAFSVPSLKRKLASIEPIQRSKKLELEENKDEVLVDFPYIPRVALM